jgi:pimeloyl-ACP methyl ester carboxylesterase
MIKEIKGRKIHFLDQGKGSPVILLHGFLESSFIWKSLADRLSQNYRVISIDLPGHGQSDCLSGNISIDHMADIIIELSTLLSTEKAQIIGHSMGGYVGLAILEKDPTLVKQLILLHSKAGADSPEVKQKREQGMVMLKDHSALFVKESLTNLFWKENTVKFKSDIDALIDVMQQSPAEGYIEALQAMRDRPDRRHLLSQFENIVYIAGKHDPVIPYAASLEDKEMLRSKAFESLDNSGHMGFIEEKDQCEKIISAYLQMA